jgi:O-antigen/teichoic acid export membrane protein
MTEPPPVQFTQQPGILRSVQGNAIATFVARLLTTTSQIAVFAVVAREFGARELDSYAVAITIATFASLLMDFGMSLWATRETAAGHRISSGLVARLPLGVATCAALAVCVAARVVSAKEAAELAVIGVAMAASLLARGVFWGHRMHDREMVFATLESWGVVILLLAARLGVFRGADPLLLTAISYGAGAIGRWSTMPPEMRPHLGGEGTIRWARTMAPFGMQNVVMTASAQLDVILLSALAVNPPVGTVAAYALALRVYYAAPMPLEALGAALLPRFVQEPGKHRRTAVAGTLIGTVIAAAGGGLFALVAPVLGYGHGLVHLMRAVLLVLTASFLARCGAYVLSSYVIARGAQLTRLAASSASLITMVALDVLLIPLDGPYGAAWAMVASDWVLLVGYALGSRHTARKLETNLVAGGL